MPRVDNNMSDSEGGAHSISTLDLTKGYWQYQFEKKMGEKTVFTTPFEMLSSR